MISNESKTFGFFNKLSKFLFRNWFTEVPHGLYINYNLVSSVWSMPQTLWIPSQKDLLIRSLLKFGNKNSSITMLIEYAKCRQQILLTGWPFKTLQGSCLRKPCTSKLVNYLLFRNPWLERISRNFVSVKECSCMSAIIILSSACVICFPAA